MRVWVCACVCVTVYKCPAACGCRFRNRSRHTDQLSHGHSECTRVSVPHHNITVCNLPHLVRRCTRLPLPTHARTQTHTTVHYYIWLSNGNSIHLFNFQRIHSSRAHFPAQLYSPVRPKPPRLRPADQPCVRACVEGGGWRVWGTAYMPDFVTYWLLAARLRWERRATVGQMRVCVCVFYAKIHLLSGREKSTRTCAMRTVWTCLRTCEARGIVFQIVTGILQSRIGEPKR